VLRYGETMYDLYQKGFSVYAMDEQGQGESERLLSNPDKGYVRDFQDYVNDLDGWINEVVLKEVGNSQLFFLGHSMGGAIGTLYDHQHPGVFTKIAVVAPMFEIQIGGNTKYHLAFHAVQRAVLSGLGEKFLPGTGFFDEDEFQFLNNIYNHSFARFLNSKTLYHQRKTIALGGPTFNWAYQAIMAGWKFYKIGPEMRTPMLLVQAENDRVVYSGVQNELCGKHPDCRLYVAKGANHDALQESDSIRDGILEKVANFF
jgi:lysophospholipase